MATLTDSSTNSITFGDNAQGKQVIGNNQGNVTYNETTNIYQQLVATEQIDPKAAAALLANLPTDTIVPPGPISAASRMPYAHNPHFVGREADMMTIAAAFKHDSATVAIAAATGIGGIGKTQLASEFAHRYGQFFAGGVYWLSFANPETIPTEIANCANPQEVVGLDLPQQVAWVQRAWQSPIPRLLIFDNCEDETLLQAWQPIIGGCRVLVTSRLAHWENPGVHTLPLDTLTREESIALLRQFRPDLPADDADLNALAHELGDLPLALHLAGSYLKRYANTVTPAKLLSQLQRPDLLNHRALQGEHTKQSPTQHDLNVGRTFALSYDRIQTDDTLNTLAQRLLARMAYFAPGEPVPYDLLVKTVLDEEQAEDEDTQIAVEDALVRLKSLGLLEDAGDAALRLHRLLAMFVQQVAADDTAQAAVEQTMQRVAYELNETGDPRPLLALQSHLRHITDVALPWADERAAELGNTLGYHLDMVGDYPAARHYYERALAIFEATLGATHITTATSRNNLGMLLQTMGDYPAARSYFERALAIFEATLGATHPATARSLNNLGGLFDLMGEYAMSRSYYEQALAIFEATLGATHPDTATSLNNLGVLLKSMGEYALARPYYERALAICEATLGATHPDTAISLNNLGALLDNMGKYAAARPYYERALAIHEAVLGTTHPHTATSLNNLGGLLYKMGEYAAARPYYERALAIREQVLGPTHPDTAQSLNNMGLLLDSMGKYTAARPYYERALAICETMIGLTHPHTATVLNNLAILCYYQQDYQQAAELMQRALAIVETTLGVNHPNTNVIRKSLAAMEEQLSGG